MAFDPSARDYWYVDERGESRLAPPDMTCEEYNAHTDRWLTSKRAAIAAAGGSVAHHAAPAAANAAGRSRPAWGNPAQPSAADLLAGPAARREQRQRQVDEAKAYAETNGVTFVAAMKKLGFTS